VAPTGRPLIVVGYDGSPVARAAVRHGIDRVGRDGLLIVVHAYELPVDLVGMAFYEDALDAIGEAANRTLDELERSEPRLAEIDWERSLVLGPPAGSICEIAADRDADEIIVGTRGVGRFRGLLGSLAHDVLHRADRPVLVIPERLAGEADAARSQNAAED